MALQVVAETDSPDLEEIYRETAAKMAPEPRYTPPPVKRDAPTKEAMMALQAVASLLTVRLALVLAVIGAFVLGMVAINHESQVGLYVLGIFSLIVACLSWLAQRRVN